MGCLHSRFTDVDCAVVKSLHRQAGFDTAVVKTVASLLSFGILHDVSVLSIGVLYDLSVLLNLFPVPLGMFSQLIYRWRLCRSQIFAPASRIRYCSSQIVACRRQTFASLKHFSGVYPDKAPNRLIQYVW